MTRHKKDEYRHIDEETIYLNIDKISQDKIDSLLPQLTQAKSIICDLRGYPNGNHKFIRYLLNEADTTTGWMQIPQIIYPDLKNITTYNRYGWTSMMTPLEPHIDAKVVYITNNNAISYAESYMGFIDNYELATIVGQATAGTNGNVNPFHLPGGYKSSFTGMKVFKHDGSQLHGVGILPDIYVEKTIEGVRNGRDEYLEKALEVVKKPTN